MTKKQADKIIEILSSLYEGAKPQLNFTSEYELLVAVMLSAQCTDERVNKVTSVLFKDYNTPTKLATLTQEELAKIILPCGLNNSKAKNILSATNSIINNFSGQVPSDFDELISLDGVGRKTADVVLSVAFNKDAIAVDTHVFRVSNRLGLSNGSTPYKVEMQLMQILKKEVWSKAHHYLIYHGRRVCKAQKPNCQSCALNEHCKYYKVNRKTKNDK
ncbi:MAG: endonuclease III [Clostridia bacterium]|nr:endonuclease III [Clostridia bacterium]